LIKSSGLLEVERPQGATLRIKPCGFESALYCGIARVNLRCKTTDAPASGVFNQPFQQRTADPAFPPRVFDKKFDEVHRFAAIFGSPLVTSIGKSAEASLNLCDKNDAQFRRFQNAFVHALSVARCRTRVPLMQQLFDELAQTRNISGTYGPHLYCRRVRRFHLGHIVELEFRIPKQEFGVYSAFMLRKSIYGASLLALIFGAVFLQNRLDAPLAAAADIQVSPAQFAQYIEELSEPEGYFDTDNFISNETSYQHVIPELRRVARPGFVYLGVGPDQNFAYIVHSRPTLAIITDIRRQNMLEHLLYKALFDLSSTRVEFIARLFSREIPKVDSRLPLRDLLRSIRLAGSGEALYRSNFAAVRDRLNQKFALRLNPEDFKRIEYVYRTLFDEGLDLRFSSIGRNNAMNYPTFESLLLQTDRSGQMQGYLATEEAFQWMKRFEGENRLVPIVGDFAGPKAFKSVGSFLKKNGLAVSVFYTSNVEYYLFENGQWRRYIENVRSLPVTEDAVFIRAYFSNAGGVHPQNVPGHRSTTLIQSMRDFLRDAGTGRLGGYSDLVFR